MNRLLGPLALLFAWGTGQSVAGNEAKPPTEQFQALIKEYHARVDAFEKAFEKVEGELQREEYYNKNYPPPEKLYPRLMTLAQKDPKSPAAVDSLAWIVLNASNEPKDQRTQRQALALLRRDHLASDRLPQVFDAADEEFLRAVLEKSPYRHVRGLACYAAAEHKLMQIRQITRWRNEVPDWRQRKWLERTGFSYLITTDIDEATRQSEKLLERVMRDFADLAIEGRRNGRTLGDLAQGHLHEIRHLAIGKSVPDLQSVDLEGKPVRLSDLRGKVVVLDVWATWCGPCRSMIPHQRALVKRLTGRPFALVSISVDDKRATLTEFLKKESMPWTHWYNGPQGQIIKDLNVWSYPTIYVLDPRGVIRSKDVRGQFLDRAVDAALKEVE